MVHLNTQQEEETASGWKCTEDSAKVQPHISPAQSQSPPSTVPLLRCGRANPGFGTITSIQPQCRSWVGGHFYSWCAVRTPLSRIMD